jgi:hypothetical protein
LPDEKKLGERSVGEKKAQVFLRRVPMWSVHFLDDVIMILAG